MGHRETPDAVRHLIDGIDHNARLSRPESQHFTLKRLETERELEEQEGRKRIPESRKVQAAVDRWSEEAGWVALGLQRATALLPPPTRPAARSAPGVSNPTSSQWWSTLDAIERGAERFAHLAGPCARNNTRDDEGRKHECPAKSAAYIADLFHVQVDATAIVDDLIGVSATSPRALAAAVDRASAWHSTTASMIGGAWTEARRMIQLDPKAAAKGGLDDDLLEKSTRHIVQLSHRMLSLSGDLADWSGRLEDKAGIDPKTCDCPGICDLCGADICTDAGIPHQPGWCDEHTDGRTECERCRQRLSRHRRREHNTQPGLT